MKAYTDIEQSKKLAEILPIESADMCFENEFPCWSLAALLDNIPQIKLDSISQFNRKHWRCCSYFSSDWHSSEWYDNPIDACYEIIIKLYEQKIL